jgi:polar amino acid transport system permease protein
VSDAGWVKSDQQLAREERRRRLALRSATLATISTVVLLGVVALIVLTSPGWPVVRRAFFSWPDAKASFPDIARAFWVNIQLFLTADPVILVIGLAVAVVRGTRSPVMFPLRALAIAYTDLFRGVPTLLLVFLVGFGLPALNLQGVPNSPFVLGWIALILSYGAYVAEVFRAGIDSVHRNQRASGRARGLTEAQTMRYVVLPQAVRNVIPPLLNDFVSLQTDTALVSVIGVVETLRVANVYASSNFNYTPYVVAAMFFIVLTIPLARFTDRLTRRSVERQFGTSS